MSKKVVLANIILPILYMQLTIPIVCLHVDIMASRFCLEVMVWSYHVYCDIWQVGSKEKLRIFFGKVPHSSFASCGHVCINTEDATLVIITPSYSLRGKNVGTQKIWRTSIHSPNLPKFTPSNIFCYTVPTIAIVISLIAQNSEEQILLPAIQH